ncbi:uncharacterized protein PGTG_09990 [Puccinia graminis f. sp. tritici CRL 75-36-700-3]|uniref:Uncharacterized protein n=1 Tax=Puccinia graminis f. sp. tritici (strain CRL 75-36-700-3 / race SCCL) TaxID=418459 RepID=E3KEX7_PUCGT|nr:uncharacterized protein PGTG_09990 [Puccinia graminis f. sp. tritici CRL 75-36-700-3]EFP83022.1 hypothetical protein PGTG_09990 [Puccinia graminis f. sp. tritici CRL 75-36-700-3]
MEKRLLPRENIGLWRLMPSLPQVTSVKEDDRGDGGGSVNGTPHQLSYSLPVYSSYLSEYTSAATPGWPAM